MKAYATCKRGVVVALVLLVSWLCGSQGLSDVGGGSGEPITPYTKPGIVVDKNTVTRLKENSSRNKYVLGIPIPKGEWVRLAWAIGLAYVRSGRIEGDVRFAFSGIDEEGDKLELDFSEVERFEVLGKDGDVLVLLINHFPAITPEELLSKRPSYRELRSKYEKSVHLRLSPRAVSGARLYLVGIREGDKHTPIVPLEDIELKYPIELEESYTPGAYWWAIPSVASDPAYPHRAIMAW